MKPIKFKEQNCVYGKDQSEYMPLPALKIQSENGEIISCWQMSLIERIYVLFTGKVWLSIMMFNKPLAPSFIAIKKSHVFKIE